MQNIQKNAKMQNLNKCNNITTNANMQTCEKYKFAKLGAYSLGGNSSWSTDVPSGSALTALNGDVGAYNLRAYSS